MDGADRGANGNKCNNFSPDWVSDDTEVNGHYNANDTKPKQSPYKTFIAIIILASRALF